jgi:hypothetical protein
LKATDPDGDAVTFTIETQPKKGTVELSDDGTFTYTPKSGKKGSDSFTYTASDTSGAVSESATVKIDIKKQSTKITYSDMDGNCAAYEAVLLAENGIYIGQQLGGEYFFCPDEAVTRSEFLAMCMNLNGGELLSGVTHTGFYDDSDMKLWQKTYVSTALMSGYISGYKDSDGHLVFGADNDITYSQAAVILNNVLGISDVVSVASFDDTMTPSWAYQASVNLTACGITADNSSDYSHTLTRAEAAQLLAGAISLLEVRG